MEILGIEYFTTVEVAARLGVSANSVRRWCDYRLFEGVVDRGKNEQPRYFIPVESLESFVPPSRDGGAGWPAGKKRSP